jgi:hypothetical protein
VIPFLAIAGAKASGFLKAIPRWAWYALAAALVLFLVYRWHNGKVEDAYKQGVATERAEAAKRAQAVKAKADARSSKITAEVKEKHDETVRIIYRDADALRVSGPGKASVSRSCLPSPTSEPAKPAREGMAPVAEVSPGERVDLIGLPFAATVAGAEQCDLNRAEVQTWRDWYAKQSEAWKKIER